MPSKHSSHSEDMESAKQRIIDAAIELFANKGYAATSISDISSTANANRALIYYYFKDKLDLYDYILKSANDASILVAQEAYEKEKTSLARLRRFISQFSQLRVQQSDNIGRVVLRSLVDNNPDTEKRMEEGFLSISAILKKILEEGIESGEFRVMDVERTVHFIHAITHSLFMMQTRHPGLGSPDENVDHAIDVLAHGILNPGAASP